MLRNYKHPFLKIVYAAITFTCLVRNSTASDPVAISPDGKYLLIGLNHGKFEVRDTESGDAKHLLFHQGAPAYNPSEPATAVNWTPRFAFSKDSSVFCSSCGYAPVLLWEAKTGTIIRELKGSAVGYDLSFSPDGSRVVGTGVDGIAGPRRLSLWDTRTGEKLKDLIAETGFGSAKKIGQRFKTAKFSPSGSTLLIEYTEGEKLWVRVWNAETAEETIAFETPANAYQLSRLSPDGQRLMIRRELEVIENSLWNTASGKIIQQWNQIVSP